MNKDRRQFLFGCGIGALGAVANEPTSSRAVSRMMIRLIMCILLDTHARRVWLTLSSGGGLPRGLLSGRVGPHVLAHALPRGR